MKIWLRKVFAARYLIVVLLTQLGIVWSETNWDKVNEICGVSYSDRIVGGTRAALGQFPWIAHLGILRHETKDKLILSYECGGALIHPRYVLTAAHCAVGMEKGESLSVVKLGEHDLESKIDCENGHCADPPQIINIKTIIIPKEYDDNELQNDLAIAELLEPANITNFVSPVCLPNDDMASKNFIHEIVEVAGWGYFDIDDPRSSPILQTVKLPVVDIENCKKIKQLSHFNFSQGHMCVGGIAGKDSCNGDSGGPLTKVMLANPTQGPRYFLFGVVSVGIPSCGKFSLPAVYTNVSHYLPWVKSIVND